MLGVCQIVSRITEDTNNLTSKPMAAMMRPYEILETTRLGDVKVDVLRFQLPLSYLNTEFGDRKIQVTARLCQKYDPEVKDLLPSKPKLVAFIQGGPGFPCSPPHTNMAYTKVFLDRGYQMIYMDQRGTGSSTPLDYTTFAKLVPKYETESTKDYTARQLQFILNFTGASIVEDMEQIRSKLIGDQKWSISGQSFGGFCSFIYLSKYPQSLKEGFVTGGVPPINHGPDDVYRATYGKAKERNRHFYQKYPQDVHKVKEILNYLDATNVTFSDGSYLSVERFQGLGLNFGGHGGTDLVHDIVLSFYDDLQLFGQPSYGSLSMVKNLVSFGTNIIYALFQESIYCDGNNPVSSPSNWSADRLRYLPENHNFQFEKNKEEPIYFTTEMVFKSMYEDFAELRPFKALAEALHSHTEWPELYQSEVLSTLSFQHVPIVGAIYIGDLYVEYNLTMKVLQETFKGINFRPYITNEFFHNGYRKDPERVMGTLFSLLESEVD